MPISADTFRALGDRTRLSLFEFLIERPHRVNELVSKLSIPQPAVSRHLRVLKDAGLVQDERQGRGVTYKGAEGSDSPPSLLCDWAVELVRRSLRPGAPPDRRTGEHRAPRPADDLEFVVRRSDETFDSYLL